MLSALAIPFVMVPQPMGDITMHIQLSGNSRLPCTSCNIPTALQSISSCKWFLLLMPAWLSLCNGSTAYVWRWRCKWFHSLQPISLCKWFLLLHAFRFGYLGFLRGTIAACKLKHRSGRPLLRQAGGCGFRFMLILGCLFFCMCTEFVFVAYFLEQE
ncbi:hypothetical protein AVEN_32657-1 [Araneus ventricosus]|uniref:Uncharacterized protein n=1 Tax=Araneus ventricosus TaxID=182803 RepID=A0A4Y2C985_ARAVE|nr:hypothetical protein AVEN_32657-1 [Araneus ventricosus]